MKIDRLIGILMLLINRKKVTAKYLSEHFEVSVRTIQRDMDTLSAAGIPLYADVGINGGYQLLDNYKLEKGFLNKDEANVLFSFLQSLEKAAPYSEVKSIFNKFSTLSNNSLENTKLVVKLNPNDTSELFNESLANITYARDHQKKLKVRYYNASFIHSTRIVCPYTLAMLGSTWYLYGYCELKSSFRMFKVSRIVESEVMNECFDLEQLPDVMPWDVYSDNGRKDEKIILKIDKSLQGNLPEYFSPDNCKITENFIEAELNFPVDEWLYSLLLSLVPHVKIIEPKFVRDEFINRLKKSLTLNNYDI